MPLQVMIVVVLLTFAMPLLANDQQACASTRYDFNVNSQGIEEALSELAQQAGCQLLFSYDVVELQKSKQVVGRYDIGSALAILLEGTVLSGRLTEYGVIVITLSRNKTNRRGESMNSKKKILASTIAFFMGGGEMALAQTQNSSSEEAWLLEEIVVTAQKREQSLKDVPISIVAFGEDDLNKQGITNLQDLALATPGLSLDRANGLRRVIVMRGIGNPSGNASLIGIYLDEASMTGGPGRQLDVRPLDLQRVEVLRGPQGTLYGEGSVGGTIRFITNAPELDAFSASMGLSATSTQGGDASQEIKGVVNIPLVEDVLGLRIAGLYENLGGWIDQPLANKEDINDGELSHFRATALWQASDALQIKASALVHRNNGSPNRAEDDNGNFTQVFNQLTSPSTEDDYEVYSLTATYDFDGFQLLSSSSHVNREHQIRDTGGNRSFVDGAVVSHQFLDNSPQSFEAFNQELRLSSTGDGAWQWTVGGFYRDATDNFSLAGFFGAPLPLGTPTPAPLALLPPVFNLERHVQSQSWAVFGNSSYQLTDRLEVGAGLRYFEDDRELVSGNNQSGTFDSLNPRFYASYDVTDAIRPYASIAKGFRSGGFNALGQPSYDPESLWTYELGVKLNALDGRLSADIALFNTDYDDYQISETIVGVGSILSNAGKAEVQGIEWDLSLQATEALSLGFRGNYVNAEYAELNPGVTIKTEGRELDGVPDYNLTLFADLAFNAADRPGYVRLDYSQQGRSYFHNPAIPNRDEISDIIKMLNLQASWDWSEQVTVGLFARNLLNDRGYVSTGVLSDSSARSRPRSVGLEANFTF